MYDLLKVKFEINFKWISSKEFLDRLQYKYGLINHALAGALREVVQVWINIWNLLFK